MFVSNTRYKFWKVFWIVLALQLAFVAFGIVSSIMFSEKILETNKMFSWQFLFRELISLLSNATFYFITLNIFNRLIVKRAGFVHYVKISILAYLCMLAYRAALEFLVPVKELGKGMKVGALVYIYTVISLLCIGLSLLIAYFNNLRDEKKQRKLLEAQKMQLEMEKSQANLNFLKAQINPHFLHNTLNYLYAKALPLSDELSEGILTLSDIMRYALSDGNTLDGKSLLKEEIEHVQNVIRIQQLRFSNKLNVDISINGSVNGARIIPFVLITLVENAFKHGDLKNAEYPITIKINIEKGVLYFFCRNKKKTGPKEISTGLGLDNIRSRLELAYGDKHFFSIKDEAEFYTTELTINSL